MKKKTGILLAALLLCVCAASCAPAPEETGVPQVNPHAEAVSKDTATTRLYFGYRARRLLVGENRSFDVPVNENPETAIIEQLVNPGSSPSKVEFTQLINPNTRVVNVTSEGEFLFVTLSREFLESFGREVDASDEEAVTYERDRKFLAVCSIVNTLKEQGTYSRVALLVDDEGTGNGRPLTNAEAGLAADTDAKANDPAETFDRNGEIVLTPRNTMQEILNATEKNEWDTLYEYIAYKNASGQDKPSLEDFRSEMSTAKFSISNYAVIDDVVSQDGKTDVVLVNYDLKLQGGELKSKTGIPVRLVLENDVWKIAYNVFKTKFMS